MEALQLFNEKAKKLEGLSFGRLIRRPDSGVTLSWNLNEATGKYDLRTEFRGPSAESADAFLLTLRFFIQDNERTSLRNLAAIYESDAIPPEVKARFDDARQKLNEYLDSPPSFEFSGFDGTAPLTRRRLLDVYLYGDLAHANPDKRLLHETWTQDPGAAAVMRNEFYLILESILRVVSYVRGLNEEVLQGLEP